MEGPAFHILLAVRWEWLGEDEMRGRLLVLNRVCGLTACEHGYGLGYKQRRDHTRGTRSKALFYLKPCRQHI